MCYLGRGSIHRTAPDSFTASPDFPAKSRFPLSKQTPLHAKSGISLQKHRSLHAKGGVFSPQQGSLHAKPRFRQKSGLANKNPSATLGLRAACCRFDARSLLRHGLEPRCPPPITLRQQAGTTGKRQQAVAVQSVKPHCHHFQQHLSQQGCLILFFQPRIDARGRE